MLVISSIFHRDEFFILDVNLFCTKNETRQPLRTFSLFLNFF